ncbi:Yip1 family protein [Metabacillus arenae]|uniref:YIP1 family protein n=1 Tax=Metabacillus arenae TaxID=2771434 RepID=A0A926ND62_9BACI|nr:Yip1 family protein [Metabacillus arenae]MBD1381314.1 YIP1 family protein [Metabacillus arenae]
MENQPEVTVKNNVSKPSIFGMFTSPNLQFERIRERPAVLVPLLIVILVSFIGSYFVANSMDFVGPAVEQGMGVEEAEALAGISKVTTIIFGGIAIPIVLLISALIYFAIVKIAGTEATFKQLFSFVTFVSIITVTGALLNGIVAYFTGTNPETYVTSLNSFVGAEGGLGGALNTIEVFGIWGTILTGMGLHKVAGLSKGAAWTVAIIFFVFGLVMGAVAGIIGGMAV